MKKLLRLLAAASIAIGCDLRAEELSAVSPDGRNEILLREKPLSFEIRRDGCLIVERSSINMKINGALLDECCAEPTITHRKLSGVEVSTVYKKGRIDLSDDEMVANFGNWRVRLVARNDGVAYRFETFYNEEITVDEELASVVLPKDSNVGVFHLTKSFGMEEGVTCITAADKVVTKSDEMVYLPAMFTVGAKTVVVTDADVNDYPVWNLVRKDGEEGINFSSKFEAFPSKTYRSGLDGWDNSKHCEARGRWEVVERHASFLVKTPGTRPFPWRVFILADDPAGVISSDLVRVLSRPAAEGSDFTWVMPGKVTWEWWNAWDNIGDPLKGGADGCTTETYRRFFDLAAEYGVEYVIFDEGWSKKLDIWHLNENVDLKALIDYGNKKGVGTILWMAWGQIVGDEERVACEFAKMGVKGFKVDFMDRGDAACERFYWDFAKACAKNKLVVDYHGAHRPTGLSRAYPNVLNYEGVHGLEQMKFYKGQDVLANDVAICFTRMSAGPMDYTPGAMDNYPVGKYPSLAEKDVYTNPGSLGTRCRQMAMMVLYEAPLQMLCDSVKKYRANAECFKFMAKTPVVWDDTVGLGGSPWTYAAIARKAKDGSWYAAAITNKEERDIIVDTSFLGAGMWKVESFSDAADADVSPTHYTHSFGKIIAAGAKIKSHLAPGGGVVFHFFK